MISLAGQTGCLNGLASTIPVGPGNVTLIEGWELESETIACGAALKKLQELSAKN